MSEWTLMRSRLDGGEARPSAYDPAGATPREKFEAVARGRARAMHPLLWRVHIERAEADPASATFEVNSLRYYFERADG